MEQETLYKKKGQAQGAVGAIVMLVVGVGIAVLLTIFVGALGGQTFELVEPDLDAISNETIRNSVKNSIVSSFEAMEQTTDYLPLIVLAVIIMIVMTLVLGLGAFGGFSGGRSAL